MSKKNDTTNTTITFEIVKHIATLHTSPSGWAKELNIVKWGDNEPTLDVRPWNPDHTKMSKGISLTKEEAKALIPALTQAIAEAEAPAEEPKAKKPRTKRAAASAR